MGQEKEYVIWGIPQGESSETLLLATPEGKPITELGMAKRLVKVLEEKYGARKVRIQEIDLTGEFDWMKAIGASRDRIAKELDRMAARLEAGRIMRLKGFDRESGAVSILMDLLDKHPGDRREIMSKAADVMLTRSARMAPHVIERDCQAFVKKVLDAFTEEYVRDVDPLAVVNQPGFADMAGKVLSVGIVNSLADEPAFYARFLDKSLAQEFSDLAVQRGKQKFENMMENRG